MMKPKDSRNPANVVAGQNLKYFMEVRGISMQQLADSFGIEKESLQKILSGRNAISGPYNNILVKTYNCDLNFIYGGIEHSDTLVREIDPIGQYAADNDKLKAISRQLCYLAGCLDNLDKS